MAAPLTFLRPSAFKALERLPLASLPRRLPTRRCLATLTPRPHRFGPTTAASTSSLIPLCQRRHYSDSKAGENEGSVTEEASRTAEIMGEEGVNLEEFGTPASEIFKRENDIENAPEIIKEELNNNENKPTSSMLSPETTAILFPPDALSHFPNPTPKAVIPPYRPPIPLMPIPALHSIHHREHPLIRQLTPCFMKHGELATAQSTVQKILQILRTKPAPREGKYPLVPNAPDLSLLPGDPVAYLQTAIDSVAPLFKLKSTRGSGGSVNQTPVPLPVRTRRRKALQWMLQAADGKKRMKSLPERFAEEVESVVLGTSSCWDKRLAVHKLCVTNRANIEVSMVKKGRKRLSR